MDKKGIQIKIKNKNIFTAEFNAIIENKINKILLRTAFLIKNPARIFLFGFLLFEYIAKTGVTL
jgi:hypothetical protein